MIGTGQDGNCDFVSLLAVVGADGTALPPLVIYSSQSEDLQDAWIEGFDPENHSAYFTASDNGWSDDDYALSWLDKVFNCHTRGKAGRGYCVYP